MSEKETILDADPAALTPGMRQYQDAKRANPDCLIMLRMGDFYELFYEDAITASRELEITLTSRGKGDKKAPLAGVPYHALEVYLSRLIKKGYKVAIIEQLEDPRQAKGLVKRGLTRIVTPGTVMEVSMLPEKDNNYIGSVRSSGDHLTAAICDISTGEFWACSYEQLSDLTSEFTRLGLKECLLPESLKVNQELITKIKSLGCFLNFQEDYHFAEQPSRQVLLNHFNLSSIESFGLETKTISVCGGLLHYLTATQKNSLPQITRISVKNNSETLLLDSSTIRNLELIRNIRDNGAKGTLLSILDRAVTAMGARLLKKWLQAPLLNREQITLRLDAVAELQRKVILREEIISLLNSVQDLERLISRINYGNSTPRDLLALRNSLQNLPPLKQQLAGVESDFLRRTADFDPLPEIYQLISASIRDDAPAVIREGGMIKPNYHQELDQWHHLTKNSQTYLAQLEEKERTATGISSLKISYNRVFGYFIEITKKNLHLVPANYVRKQTTAAGERYITEDLKLAEEKILSAQEKIAELEYNLFQEITAKIAQKTVIIQMTAAKLAALDVLCCLAKIAMEYNYCRPQLAEQGFYIKNGRHPVIEQLQPGFISNNINLAAGEMMIITGPNMAGKSTVMRQTALILLMAQMGSFVPAEECLFSPADRIFTRIGAHDDLSSGQSTFMVEMLETAAILNNATENSLIILDEIGRGTSTFDGVSIAWSVAEYIYNKIRAKTLCATHYHVLNKLAERCAGIKNYNIAVKEVNGELVFLHKLVPGSTDQSYGVHVAKYAGLPLEVIERAKQIQSLLEKDDQMIHKIKAKKLEEQRSLEGF